MQYLLSLLKSRTNLSNNPATVIAQIVSALKTMSQNLNYGDQVLHILNADPIWAEFRDQNHDLFITDSQKRLCIQGKVLILIFFKFNLIFSVTFHYRSFKSRRWLFDSSTQSKNRSANVSSTYRPQWSSDRIPNWINY